MWLCSHGAGHCDHPDCKPPSADAGGERLKERLRERLEVHGVEGAVNRGLMREALVALGRVEQERDKWLDLFNRSEQFQSGPIKRAEQAEAALASAREEASEHYRARCLAEQQIVPQREYAERAAQALASAREKIGRLREALSRVEYVTDYAGDFYCPWCRAGEQHGHAENCVRQKALAATPQEGGEQK